jgi:L-ornithine Nalpha-acyltransferase
MNALTARLSTPRIAADCDDATSGRQTQLAPAIFQTLPALFPKISALAGMSLQRPLPNHCETLGRMGSLEVRLARSAVDMRRAQRLRYRVFYGEMSAAAGPINLVTQRDVDEFDALCDHVLIFDQAPAAKRPANLPVATCRLLRQDMAERHGGFYTAGEYRLAELLARQRGLRFLELGRSCVLRPYRGKRTVELLWHGIWSYVVRHGFEVLVGCASFEGIDPDKLALPLSYLHHYASAPEAWRLPAQPHRYVEMNRLPKRAVDIKAALRDLPPLIKGYLRLGAYVGHGAVIDRKFGTTDVAIVLPVSAINARYVQHFGPTAARHAA